MPGARRSKAWRPKSKLRCLFDGAEFVCWAFVCQLEKCINRELFSCIQIIILEKLHIVFPLQFWLASLFSSSFGQTLLLIIARTNHYYPFLVCNATNVLLRYNWHLDLTNDKTAVDLGLQSVKKYWRHAAQVADELSYLLDFLLALAVVVNKVCGDYNQKIQLDKRLRFRQDRDHKWVFSYFVKLYASV